jgi:hypothetical protein
LHTTGAQEKFFHDIKQDFSLFFQQSVPESMLKQLKECFMEAYDDNRDGKIEIREVQHGTPIRRG